MTGTECGERLAALARLVEDGLDRLFREPCDTRLFESMRYSLTAGGKRLRPVLLLAVSDAAGTAPEAVLDFALGVELIHTYSLIHDDLPCMDDDELRRGRPSSHMVFGEAGALLAGDALLNAAFELMFSCRGTAPENVLAAGAYFARCSGREGMILGQSLDLADAAADAASRERLSRLKTGCLLEGACVSGLLLAGVRDEARLDAARIYAQSVGVAFQIRDDLLDAVSTPEVLGKPVGSDKDKTTFVDLLGPDGCEARIGALTDRAAAAAELVDPSGFLAALARRLAERTF